MQISVRFMVTVLLLGSYLLSACTGAVPQGNDNGESANSNEVINPAGNVNDNSSNANDGQVNENGDDNSNDVQGNQNDNANSATGADLEFFGVVESLTTATITIDGVEYNFADFTEFKDVVSVGDQVKIHVIVNADGSFTIREIELSAGDGQDNSNGNLNSNDNVDDHVSNSNSNGNDDDNGNHNTNSNSNDDNKDHNSNSDD